MHNMPDDRFKQRWFLLGAGLETTTEHGWHIGYTTERQGDEGKRGISSIIF